MDVLRELGGLVVRHAARSGRGSFTDTSVGLAFTTLCDASAPSHRVYEPRFGLVVQGEKQLVLGDQVFTCGKGSFLVVSVDLPVTFQVSRATVQQPYLSIGMTLQPAAVATLLLEAANDDQSPLEPAPAGLGVSNAPAALLEALLRLVRLLDQPRDLKVLGPAGQREILWRLLCSTQGHRLRQIGLADSRLSQIGRAMRWMREHYCESLPTEALARLSAMSVTSFHRHFRAVALMSPLQYLKQIRLQEARARLLARADDVATVGLAVGYDSPSQFSREYKRAYGAPPGKDARLLRASNGG